MKLPRSFYLQDGLTAAKALLGKTLVRVTPEGVTKGVIVETEAYMGLIDDAAHSYKGRTARTEIQYGPGGFAYVFLIYGMYPCMNIVVNSPERPEVVLLRALEPTEGLDLMAARRKQTRKTGLCSGPGKLCVAMAIDKTCYGMDLCGDALYLEDTPDYPSFSIDASTRIHIDYAEKTKDYPWRFTVSGSPYLSVLPKKPRG